MMNCVWAGLMVVSIICSICTGRVEELSKSVLNGASEAVELIISMLGMMCLWTGIMKIADKGGITNIVAKLLKPITGLLFSEYSKESKAIKYICMNITANLLGLGNAATPLGIEAMKEMQKEKPASVLDTTASNGMAMFVVINTASLQVMPTLLIALRVKYNSANAFEVMPLIWMTSVIGMIVGVSVAKIMERHERNG